MGRSLAAKPMRTLAADKVFSITRHPVHDFPSAVHYPLTKNRWTGHANHVHVSTGLRH